MEWIYSSPFNKDEQIAYIALKKQLRKDQISKRTIKLLSLMAFLRKHKFKTPEEIERSAFYDKEKRKPVFDKDTAKEVFRKLKHRGGGSESNYPFTDTLIKDGLSMIIPDFIQNPVVNIHEILLKNPTGNIKNFAPILKILADALHSGTSITVNNLESVGEGVAGPIGAAAVAPFVALATIPSNLLSTAEGDLGQIANNALSIIPIAGVPLSNALHHGEVIMRSAVDSNSSLPTYIPYVGSYVEDKRVEKVKDAVKTLTPTGGKRFSTQRNKYNKWKRTRRNKSARV